MSTVVVSTQQAADKLSFSLSYKWLVLNGVIAYGEMLNMVLNLKDWSGLDAAKLWNTACFILALWLMMVSLEVVASFQRAIYVVSGVLVHLHSYVLHLKYRLC